jgi:hypothetical protein
MGRTRTIYKRFAIQEQLGHMCTAIKQQEKLAALLIIADISTYY